MAPFFWAFTLANQRIPAYTSTNGCFDDPTMSVKFVLPEEIRNLPVSERLKLVEAIWDSIAESPEQLPLTQAQVAVLEARIAEYEKNPDAGSSWDEVKQRILKGK
jgi:putative addiction module component (TIGR02574 family)